MPEAPLKIVVTHSGLYPDGRPNTSPILIDDIKDLGQVHQLRKIPVYVPAGGSVTLPLSTTTLFSYTQGSIDKMVTAGLVSAVLQPPTGRIEAASTPTAILSNVSGEQVLYSLTIPPGAVDFGDLLRVHVLSEVTAMVSGEFRLRMRIGGGGPYLGGFNTRNSAGLLAFEFVQLGVIDTGSGLSAARLCSGEFTGVDITVDLTTDTVIEFTGETTVADAGNAFQGKFAYVGKA